MAGGTGLIRRLYLEVLVAGNYDLIDELVADGFIDHAGFPGQPPGKEGVRFFVDVLRAAFADLDVKSSEPALAEGNLEAARTVLTGTHQGEFLGVAPTGRNVEFETFNILRIEDGKVVEHWGTADAIGLLQQLGALPG